MKTLFVSDRIEFVEVSEELLDDYLEMVNDIEHVARFIGRRTEPFTAEQETKWVRRKLEEKAPIFSMIERDGGAFIGNIELMEVNGGSAELGIAITAKKQDMGYGKEAVKRIVDHGFCELGLDRIYLKVYPDNARAIRVYEACGFREYDRTEEDIFMEIKR